MGLEFLLKKKERKQKTKNKKQKKLKTYEYTRVIVVILNQCMLNKVYSNVEVYVSSTDLICLLEGEAFGDVSSHPAL